MGSRLSTYHGIDQIEGLEWFHMVVGHRGRDQWDDEEAILAEQVVHFLAEFLQFDSQKFSLCLILGCSEVLHDLEFPVEEGVVRDATVDFPELWDHFGGLDEGGAPAI